MKRGVHISDYLQPLSSCQLQAYLTNVLQVADVLAWVLSQTGKARVWQTSFSISEEFLRRLYFIQQSGNLLEFNLVLDFKATNKTLRLWPFLCQTIRNTYLADNHSKVLLIEAENGLRVTIMTSQNLTRGNRNEAAIITTDKAVFCTLRAQMEDLIQNNSVRLNDLYQQKLNT